MAVGCRKRLHTDYAIAITGIAGPDGGSEDKPVGTVYIAVAAAHQTEVRHYRFGSSREFIRARASYAALELLRRVILDIL
jgi:nicotinamide-nucleotide amidase